MTVEEKRKILTGHCSGKPCCMCALYSQTVCRCKDDVSFIDDTMTDAEIIGAYEIVFGGEIETEELKEGVLFPDGIHIDKVKNLHLTINHFNGESED